MDIARKLFAADPLAQTPSGRATLERSVGETVRAAADWIVNGDPYHPSLVWVQTPPHKWFGVDFPGNRWGIDNPDNLYATAAIDGESRYVIHGKLRRPAPAECTLTVMGRGGPYPNAFPHSNVYLSLDQSKLATDDSFRGDDRFKPGQWASQPYAVAAPIDGFAAASQPGRLEHRNAAPDFDRARWRATDAPRARQRRVGNKGGGEACATSYRRFWISTARHAIAWRPINSPCRLRRPGGLLTQITSFGHFQVADDEALVLTIDPISARYLGFQALRPLDDRDGVRQRDRLHQPRTGGAQ